MEAGAIERAAAHIAAARVAGEPLTPLPEEIRPGSIVEAHAVQDAVHDRLATAGFGTVVGRKIGATTQPMQEYLDLPHPCAGGVWSSQLRIEAATLDPSDHVQLGLEGELAVTLAQDIPLEGGDLDRRTLDRYVESWHAAIEVVDNRYGDFLALGAPTLVADDFFAAGAVLGPPVRPAELDDVAAVEGRMVDTGTEVGAGVGADVLGHPLEALAWLVGHHRALGTPLRAGDVVLLGSLFRVHWVTAASRQVVHEVRGLGSVTVELARR